MILAIAPGHLTGWAALARGGMASCGVVPLRPQDVASPRLLGAALVRWLDRHPRPMMIAIDRCFGFRTAADATAQRVVVPVVERWARRHEVWLEVRSLAAGTGRALSEVEAFKTALLLVADGNPDILSRGVLAAAWHAGFDADTPAAAHAALLVTHIAGCPADRWVITQLMRSLANASRASGGCRPLRSTEDLSCP